MQLAAPPSGLERQNVAGTRDKLLQTAWITRRMLGDLDLTHGRDSTIDKGGGQQAQPRFLSPPVVKFPAVELSGLDNRLHYRLFTCRWNSKFPRR